MDVDYSIRPKAVIMFIVEPYIMTQTWFYNVSGRGRSSLCEPAFVFITGWKTKHLDISCGFVSPALVNKFAALLKKIIVLWHSEWMNNTVYCWADVDDIFACVGGRNAV